MAIKLVDTAVPMNETGFPVARAKHIWLDDDRSLQDKLNDGELGGSGGSVELISTLTAGQTELIFVDSAITTNSTFDYYTSIYGISAKSVTVETGKLTMTFKAQSTDVDIKVVVRR